MLERLERMEVSSDEKHEVILAEVRKGNEALDKRGQADNFPPLAQPTNDHVPTRPLEKQQNRRGWEHEWLPVEDDELKMLVDREDPVRKLINHNLQGLTSIYFTREKQGNIGMVRPLIERQLKLGRVVRGLNFKGDENNEVTEILTTAKHAQAIIAANETLIQANAKSKTRRNILGPNIQQCNQYRPIWSDLEKLSAHQIASRTAHHIRSLVNQWHQCAQK